MLNAVLGIVNILTHLIFIITYEVGTIIILLLQVRNVIWDTERLRTLSKTTQQVRGGSWKWVQSPFTIKSWESDAKKPYCFKPEYARGLEAFEKEKWLILRWYRKLSLRPAFKWDWGRISIGLKRWWDSERWHYSSSRDGKEGVDSSNSDGCSLWPWWPQWRVQEESRMIPSGWLVPLCGHAGYRKRSNFI